MAGKKQHKHYQLNGLTKFTWVPNDGRGMLIQQGSHYPIIINLTAQDLKNLKELITIIESGVVQDAPQELSYRVWKQKQS